MRADFERYYREEHAGDSDYDAVEIYGTYAKTTPENDVYPAHTLYNPADVHPVRPLNEISREELIEIVSNGASSKRSSKQPSPGHSHVLTPNTSFKVEGLAATAQVRPVLDARTRQLEEENQRLMTKVRILEDNAMREREEWMTKYFDHLRDCKRRPAGEPDRGKTELQREREHTDRLQRELTRSRSEMAAMKRECEAREIEWEEVVKELKRQLAVEKQKNQAELEDIRVEFARIQAELDRVKSRKGDSRSKSSDIDSETTRRLMEKDRELRHCQKQVAALSEQLTEAQAQAARMRNELRLRESEHQSSRRSLSNRRPHIERDTGRDLTPARQSNRLLATKKGRSISGVVAQTRSNKELKKSAKEARTEELDESIGRMEARIARHRERYLSYLHSQSHSKEELARLSESLDKEEDHLAQLRLAQEELRRSRR